MKVKLKEKGSWKNIPMSHNFFSGDLEQAVCGGIEELTDYTLLKKTKKSGKVVKKDLSAPKYVADKTKRKITETEESSVTLAVPQKKKKNVFEVKDIVETKSPPEQSVKKKDKKKKVVKPAINLDVFKKLNEQASKGDSSEKNDDQKENLPDIKKKSGEEITSKVSKQNFEPESEVKSQVDSLKTKRPKKKKTKSKAKSPNDLINECDAVEVSELTEWKELFVCEEILQALADKGFKSPTPIQRMTLAASLKGKMDIVGAAETGSGKTLAFGIPIIQGILEDRLYEETHGLVEKSEEENVLDDPVDTPETGSTVVDVVDNVEMDFDIAEEPKESLSKFKGDRLRAIILTPTRELAIQIHNHLQTISRHTGVGVAVVVGGMSVEKQLRLLSRGPAVVVATPGRLWDLTAEGNQHLVGMGDSLSYLAIDETDRMVERGHFEELQKLLEMINQSKKNEENVENRRRERQTFIMSATLSLVHKPPQHAKQQRQKTGEEKLAELMEMVGVREGRRKVVDITRKVGTAETLSESVIHCALTEKDFFLYYFLKSHPGRTVIFCNSIDCVRRLTNLFSLLDTAPLPLHAQLHQRQRLKNMDRFSSDPRGLLVATDVAARGLDIPNIEHVVHYQVPRTSEGYVHRAGRTARATKSGLSLLLVEPGEQGMFRKLCLTLARGSDATDTIPTFPVDGARLSIVRERISAARRLDKMLLDTRKKTVGDNWRNKAAEEADLILSDADDSEEEFYQGRLNKGQGVVASKQTVNFARQQLNILLQQPLEQQVYGGAYPTMGGLLPSEVLTGKSDTAVEVLKDNLKQTQDLLKGKKRVDTRNKFKGFKKKRKGSGIKD